MATDPYGREGGDVGETLTPQAGRPASARCLNRRTGCSATGERAVSVGSSASSHPPSPDAWEGRWPSRFMSASPARPARPLPDGEPTPGARLHAAIAERRCARGRERRAVECLSACNNGCSVALTAPGRWSYVYGRLTRGRRRRHSWPAPPPMPPHPTASCPGATRPEIFRKQSLARIPPLSLSEAAE